MPRPPSRRHSSTVRATLPAIGGAIGEITGQFCDRLFAGARRVARRVRFPPATMLAPHSASPPTSTPWSTSTSFAAIADVLGEALTPEAAEAWDETRRTG